MPPSPRRLVLAALLACLAPFLAAGPAKAADTPYLPPPAQPPGSPYASPLARLPFTGLPVLATLATGGLLLLLGAVLARSGRYRPRRLKRPAGRR